MCKKDVPNELDKDSEKAEETIAVMANGNYMNEKQDSEKVRQTALAIADDAFATIIPQNGTKISRENSTSMEANNLLKENEVNVKNIEETDNGN